MHPMKLLTFVAAPLLLMSGAAEAKTFEFALDSLGKGKTFADGDLSFSVTPITEGADEYASQPRITVTYPGAAPLVIEGTLTSPMYSHHIMTGKSNASDTRPSFILQGFTGGAHCCAEITLYQPKGDGWQKVDLPMQDGEGLTDFPSDYDGDGTVDLILRDQNFYYAFAPYAMSWAPPVIYSVWRGKLIDLSDDPAFRPILLEDAAESRKVCTDTAESYRNGACAAYVAAMVRAGDAEQAWKDAAQYQDNPVDEIFMPSSCKVALVDYTCPEGQSVTYDNLPDALRYFLGEIGYMDKVGEPDH